MKTLDKISAADFSPFLKKRFRIYFDSSAPTTIELIELTEKKSSSEKALRQPFSIIFRGKKDRVWPQGMYTIDHQSLGKMEIFLVPIGPDDQGMRYEAVFN